MKDNSTEKKHSNIVGIMQPYFFPYIGYWQLLNAVDRYVIFDDVSYINRGWINRNRINVNGTPKYINVPMLKASQNKLINEIEISNDLNEYEKILTTIRYNYVKAPFFNDFFPILKDIIKYQSDNLADYLINSIKGICRYLDIKTEILISSELDKNNDLRGEEKILQICDILNATDYYNAIGGMELYHSEKFSEKNIKLHFLKTDNIQYPQGSEEFIEYLSIIDVLMYNSLDDVHNMLKQYSLVSN